MESFSSLVSRRRSAARQIGLLRDVPVFVAWGADDTTIPPRHHLALAERVPHAVMVETTDAGHYPTRNPPLLSCFRPWRGFSARRSRSDTPSPEFVERLTESPGHRSWVASDKSLEGPDSSTRVGLVNSGRMTPRTKYPGGCADPTDLCSDKCDNP